MASSKSASGRSSLVKRNDFYSIPQAVAEYSPYVHCQNAIQSGNEHRNRYTDILAYDSTRVRLSGDNSYINANTLAYTANGVSLHYIATQGPLEETANDFWQMVWEQGVETICMVTGLVESGRLKCFQYWPALGATTIFGDISVESKSEVDKGGYAIRTFVVCEVHGDGERLVKQCHFGAWPDHDVPKEPGDFFRYLSEIERVKSTTSPLLIHCSAGIGRTGVLMLTQTALALMQRGRVADLDAIISGFRTQRMYVVQTEVQYEFVYRSLCNAERQGKLSPTIKNVDLAQWKSIQITRKHGDGDGDVGVGGIGGVGDGNDGAVGGVGAGNDGGVGVVGGVGDDGDIGVGSATFSHLIPNVNDTNVTNDDNDTDEDSKNTPTNPEAHAHTSRPTTATVETKHTHARNTGNNDNTDTDKRTRARNTQTDNTEDTTHTRAAKRSKTEL